MILRPYQEELKNDIVSAWKTHQNVLAVLSTGGGKTAVFSDIIKDCNVPAVAIAHRQELVCQISTALAKDEVEHHIIAPEPVVRLCNAQHVKEAGKSWFNPRSKIRVCGVLSLLSEKASNYTWLKDIKLWVMDEGHHVLRKNTWGKAISLMPGAKGLGVTATPLRADGKGLGRHADGLYDTMLEGVEYEELNSLGYLCNYKIYAPTTEIDLSGVNVSQITGDYSKTKLIKQAKKSTIVGDTVTNYLKFARDKLAIVFTTDIESAHDLEKQFISQGVNAKTVTSKCKDKERTHASEDFASRRIKVLINVDLFDEGYDVPAVECVIMARPTMSLAKFRQQFGRGLRPAEGKEHLIVIDQVNNCMKHGLPEFPVPWTLDRREKKASSTAIPATCVCTSCLGVHLRFMNPCPYCGTVRIPAERSTPQAVEGDLVEMNPEMLARLKGNVNKENRHPDEVKRSLREAGMKELIVNSQGKIQRRVLEVRNILGEAMSKWGGVQKAANLNDREMQRLFYQKFGIDVLTAQTLNRADTIKLNNTILEDLI